jgi:protein-serine/threonine kinase
MEYCPRGDMSLRLKQERRFNERRARLYAAELLCGLEDLHRYNFIFRDLKPENILFDESGHIKLADFGLAKQLEEHTGVTNSFCGSMNYLAPEMVERTGHGKLMDFYLLGLVIY